MTSKSKSKSKSESKSESDSDSNSDSNSNTQKGDLSQSIVQKKMQYNERNRKEECYGEDGEDATDDFDEINI